MNTGTSNALSATYTTNREFSGDIYKAVADRMTEITSPLRDLPEQAHNPARDARRQLERRVGRLSGRQWRRYRKWQQRAARVLAVDPSVLREVPLHTPGGL